MAAQIFTPGSWFKRGDLTEAMRTSVSSARPLFQTSCKEQANHLLTKQEASAKTGPVPRARIELATHGSSGHVPSDSRNRTETQARRHMVRSMTNCSTEG